jgi:hypothetical protein
VRVVRKPKLRAIEQRYLSETPAITVCANLQSWIPCERHRLNQRPQCQGAPGLACGHLPPAWWPTTSWPARASRSMACSAHAAIDVHDITTKRTRDVDLRAAVRQIVGVGERLTSLRRARQSVNQSDADALQRSKQTPSTSRCTMRRSKVAPWPIAPFPGLIEQAMIELRNREHSRL